MCQTFTSFLSSLQSWLERTQGRWGAHWNCPPSCVGAGAGAGAGASASAGVNADASDGAAAPAPAPAPDAAAAVVAVVVVEAATAAAALSSSTGWTSGGRAASGRVGNVQGLRCASCWTTGKAPQWLTGQTFYQRSFPVVPDYALFHLHDQKSLCSFVGSCSPYLLKDAGELHRWTGWRRQR